MGKIKGTILICVLCLVHTASASLFDDVLEPKTVPARSERPSPIPRTPLTRATGSLFDTIVPTRHRLAIGPKSVAKASLFDEIRSTTPRYRPTSRSTVATKPRRYDLSSLDLVNPTASKTKTANANSFFSHSKHFSSQEKEVLDNLRSILPQSKLSGTRREKATDEILNQVSESILNLGRVFQSTYISSIQDGSTTQATPSPKGDQMSFTVREIKSLLNLVKSGRNTMKDIYYHISDEDGSPPGLELVEQLHKLGLALEVLKNDYSKDTSAKGIGSDLTLAKHLFRENIHSVRELTRNQRNAMSSFKREIMEISKENMSNDEADQIARFFTVSDNTGYSQQIGSYLPPRKTYTRPRPYTQRPPTTSPTQPPVPVPRPTRPPTGPPSPPPGPPGPPVGPPSPPVGPPSPPTGAPAPPPGPPGPPVGAPSPPQQDPRNGQADPRVILLSPPIGEQDIIFLAPEQNERQRYLPPQGTLPLEGETLRTEAFNTRWVPIETSTAADEATESKQSDSSSLSLEDASNQDNHSFHYHYHIYSNDYKKLLATRSGTASLENINSRSSGTFASPSVDNPDRLLRLQDKGISQRAPAVPLRAVSRENLSLAPPLILLDSTYTSLASNPSGNSAARAPARANNPAARNPASSYAVSQLAPTTNLRTVPRQQAAPQSTYSVPQTPPAAPQMTYGAPQAPPAAPQTTYGAPQAPPRAPQTTYGAPQAPPRAPQTTYGAPQAPPRAPPRAPQATYGAPQAPPANPAMTYGPPPQDPAPMRYQTPAREPASPPQTRLVFLKPVKKKKKLFGKKKKGQQLFTAFTLGSNSNRQPIASDFVSNDNFFDELRDQRQQLRDEFWRSREQLELHQYRLQGLDRLRTEIALQEQQRDRVSKKILKGIAKNTFGKGMKDMLYNGAGAIGSMALYPFRALSGRRKRDTYNLAENNYAQ